MCFSAQAQMPFSSTKNNSTNKNLNASAVPNTNYDEPDTTKKYEPEGIVFDNDDEADSVLTGYVFSFPQILRAVKILQLQNPTLDPTGFEFFNPVHCINGLYNIDLGALGQTQLSIYPYAYETMIMLSKEKKKCVMMLWHTF